MLRMTRRSLITRSIGIAAAGTLARPYIANAQAKTAEVWWVQGFVPYEDDAFRKTVADYEKASGNKIDASIIPFAPMREKIISAITSGFVPDAIYATPAEVVPLQAWQGRLVDVSDVVETQKSRMLPTALASAYCYNNVEKKRSYYGVPFDGSVVPFHVWKSLIEKAGHKMSDVPNTWDAFLDFFDPIQKELREKGMRNIYANGLTVSAVGADSLNTAHAFVIAYGGEHIVTPDGRLNSDDPKVKEAVLKALTKVSSLFRDGFIPPSAVNWNDSDNNNAFHAQLIVMDHDGTLSTEIAMLKDSKDAYYHDVVTMGLPLSNEGEKLPAVFAVNSVMIPTGAKNVEVAKDFAKFLIEPKVNGDFVKGGGGRWLPIMPELAKDDPWWTDPNQDPHRPPYVTEAYGGQTIPNPFVYNPGWAQVMSEHVLTVAYHDITSGGMSPEQSASKALKRMEEIFAQYEIKAS